MQTVGLIRAPVRTLVDGKSSANMGARRWGCRPAVLRRNWRIGIIGLGMGTLAAYAKPGDLFRFYEINPLVIEVAKTNFTFLNHCEGTVELVPGDARIALGREAPQGFDLLALDAFDGRVVPVHLLTREAFALYAQHLAPEGVIAVHATSKYTDRAPMIYRIAASIGRNAHTNRPDLPRRVMASTWIVSRGHPPPQSDRHVWRDDYSNPIEIMKF
jgi:spermidine synthase